MLRARIPALRRPVATLTATVAVSVLATGCQITVHGVSTAPGRSTTSTGTPAPTPTPTPEPAVVALAPSDRSTNVAPNAPVTATPSVGTITTVTLVDGKGVAVPGKLDSAGAWKASSRLRPASAYTMTVKAAGPTGRATTLTSRFTTLKPAITATYGLVANGATVGVGMPVSVQFDSAVHTKAQRAAVEKSVALTVSPAQAGAWGWLDNRQLMFRPKTYWKPGTRITLAARLTGLQTGPSKWVANDAKGTWTVGSSMVSTVDMRAHTMTVRRNGVVVKTFPVSTGRPGATTETRYGTKVIIERVSAMTMDSATVGIGKDEPGYYRIDTRWNMRLTWTGEFIHSAPWSVGAQGSANVSHGCTNMSPAAAKWMFDNSKVGDVVRFTGSNRPFLPTEGYGIWTYSWSGWKARSALAA